MENKKNIDPHELDEYEQKIEDNMDLAELLSPEEEQLLVEQLVKIGKSHNTARFVFKMLLTLSHLEMLSE